MRKLFSTLAVVAGILPVLAIAAPANAASSWGCAPDGSTCGSTVYDNIVKHLP